MTGHDIIVIGASAGGLAPLSRLAEHLPEDLLAAVFVVQHLASDAPSMLAEILSKAGTLPTKQAEDGAAIEHGHLYVARPNHHLKVERGRMRVTHGPRENRARPAVDLLFRSAAITYGPRVIGIVLSGSLDDGTAGLSAIKRKGGVAMVQDPDEAAFPDMPRSALEYVDVDYRLPVAEMGAVLHRLTREPVHEPVTAAEPAATKTTGEKYVMNSDPEEVDGNPKKRGKATAFGCPACGGPLWELREGTLLKYQCNIGHAYTPSTLLADQDDAVERALEVAMRTLEERTRMLKRMAREAKGKNWNQSASRFEERAEESEAHAESIRRLLQHDA